MASAPCGAVVLMMTSCAEYTMTSAMDQDLYDKPDGELIHLSNWVECVRSRKRPTAPVEAGVSATAVGGRAPPAG